MTDTPRSRRAVVRGVALGGLALPVLAACGARQEPTADPSPAPGTSAASSRAPRASRASQRPTPHHSASPTPQPTLQGVPIASTGDITVGGGSVIDAHGCVVTQPWRGTFKCFSDICTHAGCQVSGVEDGTINCPCHGSRFSIVDGSVRSGPAVSPLPAKQVTVAGGQVLLT